MLTLSVNLKIQQPTTVQVTTAFKNYRQRNIEESQKILLDEVHDELIRRNMNVSGDLDESFQVLDLSEVGDISKVTVGSEDIAASVAEYGANEAGGGIVNVAEILDWVRQKSIFPTYGTQSQFAFAIAKAIGQTGQPLKGGLKRPFNNAQQRAKRKIDKLWPDDLPNLLRELEQR